MPHSFTKYHFDGQAPDENLLLVLHRHWFNILSRLIVTLLMLALLFGSYGLAAYFFAGGGNPAYANLFAFLRNLFFIFIWITFFIIWIDYYFDVWIVTDKRIINIEQKGLFNRETNELRPEKIQNVTADIRGILPTFFNYGQLEIQTAGKPEKFIFHDIPDPYSVKALIMRLRKK